MILKIQIHILFLTISSFSYSQQHKPDYSSLIDKTIQKYSNRLFDRIFSYYTIASIRDYETSDYWVVSYFPEKHNKLFLQRDSLNTSKLDLIYNKVRLIGNHPVFWKEPKDTSDYDFVLRTMRKYNLIDSFFINFDPNRTYNDDEYPEFAIDDGAMVVYYVIRRSDMKIIRKFRTRKYWKIYTYMDKLK